MSPEVTQFVELGSLPHQTANEVVIQQHQDALEAIPTPVSDDEAIGLARCFGPDDCHGLAWMLVHVIESAPGWPLPAALADTTNFWIRTLSERAQRTSP